MELSKTDSQKAAIFDPVQEANLRLKLNRLEDELSKTQSDLSECLKKQDGFKKLGNVRARFLGDLSNKKGSKSKRRSTKKKSTRKNKNNFDKYIGEVVLLKIPKNKRPRWFWIVKKKDNGRYITRSSKIGILIKDLGKKRNNDFGPEKLMPLGTKLF